jgi:hypothetical protein
MYHNYVIDVEEGEVGGQKAALHVRVPGLAVYPAWSLLLNLDYAVDTNIHAMHVNMKRVRSMYSAILYCTYVL